ncbi:MAG: DUF1330 domain-containing protein, partial [Myxococcota bacterium]
AFARRSAEGPVAMLNLLKFKPEGGREMYGRYGLAVMPLLQKAGGRIVYAGEAAERVIGQEDWDSILIVEYPTRQAFLDMVMSPAYLAIQHLRDESLVRSVLYATDPAMPGAPG